MQPTPSGRTVPSHSIALGVNPRSSLPSPSNNALKGSKFRKLLGNEFDEKLLADPLTLFRQQTLKQGFSIPEEMMKETAKSVDPVLALNAYRKLPDINAIDPLLTQMFGEVKSPDSTSKPVKDNRTNKQNPVSPTPSKSLMLKNRNSNSGSIFQRISSLRGDKSPSVNAITEETKSGDSAEGVSTDDSISPYGKSLAASEINVEAIAGHSLGAPLLKSRIDLMLDLESVIATNSNDIECYFALFDANKDEFLSEEYYMKQPADVKDVLSVHFAFKDVPYDSILSQQLFMIIKVYKMMPIVDEDQKSFAGRQILFRKPYAIALVPLSKRLETAGMDKELFISEKEFFLCQSEKLFAHFHKSLIHELDHSKVPKAFDIQEFGFSIKVTKKINDHTNNYIVDVQNLNRNKFVIDPSSLGSLIYIDLLSGDFKQGKKSSSLNAQVIVRLCFEDGKKIPNSIMRGRGSGFSDQFESSVFYHLSDPEFHEQMIVKIPSIREVDKYHLYFEVINCSSIAGKSTPLTFGFIPLVDLQKEEFLADGIHKIPLFKFKYKFKAPEEFAKFGMFSSGLKQGAFDGSQDVSVFGPYICKKADQNLIISTKLVSNEVSQDLDLWALSTGKISSSNFAEVLLSIKRKDIVTKSNYLILILNCIFDLLYSGSNFKVFYQASYDAIVKIVSDLTECGKTYPNALKMLDHYSEQKWNFPELHNSLMDSIIIALAPLQQDIGIERIKNTCNSIKFLSKIALKSWRSGSSESKESFKKLIMLLFENLIKMINSSKQDSKNLVSFSQFRYLIFSYFFDILHDFSQDILTQSQVFSIFENFFRINNSGLIDSELNLQKLVHVSKVFDHKIMQTPGFGVTAVFSILDSIEYHLYQTSRDERIHAVTTVYRIFDFIKGSKISESFVMLDTIKAKIFQYASQILIIVHDVLVNGRTNQRSSHFFNESAEIIDQNDLNSFHIDEKVKQEIVAVLLKIIDLFDQKIFAQTFWPSGFRKTGKTSIGTPKSANLLSRSFDFKVGKAEPPSPSSNRIPESEDLARQDLENLLEIFYILVEDSVLAENEYWILLRAKEIYSAVHLLELLSGLQFRSGAKNTFWRKVWKLFIVLFEHKFPKKTAPKFLELLEGEFHTFVASYGSILWKVTPVRLLFNDLADILVPCSIRMSMAFNASQIHQLFLTIYFDLLLSELELFGVAKKVEGYSVDSIDLFFIHADDRELSRNSSDKEVFEYISQLSSFADNFCSSMDLTSERKESIIYFVKGVEEQCKQLLALQKIGNGPETEDIRIDALSNLIELFKQKGRTELYERYLLQMIEAQKEYKNFVEAGQGLLLFASALEWNDDILPAIRTFPKETCSDRKIRVMKEAIGVFHRVKHFERCVEVYRQLSYVHEKVQYDYNKASQVLKTMAHTLEGITNEDRLFPQFYRLLFFGNGFSDDLRGKEIVYKSGTGPEVESVIEFTNRIKSMYPEARVFNSSDPIQDMLIDGQHIQIASLQCSSSDEFIGKNNLLQSSVSSRIRNYYLFNEIDVFKYSYISKEHQAKSTVNVKNDFSHLWVNQVYLFVKNKLPWVKRRELVISKKEKLISPFLNAITSIQSKNNEILEKISQFIASEKRGNPDVGPLSMILNGVIDAAVSGGMKKYEEAFMDSNYLQVHSEDAYLVSEFQKALGDQLVVLAKGLQLFEQHCGEQLRPLYNHLSDLFEKMKIQEERLL